MILTGELAHHLAQREVGDPVSVRDATADQDSRACLERADQLAHQARLADPGCADDRRQLAGTGLDGLLERFAENCELLRSGRRTAFAIGRANAGTSGLTAIESPGRKRLALPFRVDRLPRPRRRPLAPTTPYVFAPSSTSPGAAACSSRAATLTASPVASRWSVAESAPPTTTSPVLTPVRVVICTPCSRSSSSFSRSSAARSSSTARTGPRGVVLPDDRHAEHGHHRIADELLHRSAVALHCGLGRREVARHHAAQRLRIEAFAERRRSGQVDEDDGDGLSRGGVGRALKAAPRRHRRIVLPRR